MRDFGLMDSFSHAKKNFKNFSFPLSLNGNLDYFKRI